MLPLIMLIITHIIDVLVFDKLNNLNILIKTLILINTVTTIAAINHNKGWYVINLTSVAANVTERLTGNCMRKVTYGKFVPCIQVYHYDSKYDLVSSSYSYCYV